MSHISFRYTSGSADRLIRRLLPLIDTAGLELANSPLTFAFGADPRSKITMRPGFYAMRSGSTAPPSVEHPPEWVFEVQSGGCGIREKSANIPYYEALGVKELWIFFEADGVCVVRVLEKGKYGPPCVYSSDEPITLKNFPLISVIAGR